MLTKRIAILCFVICTFYFCITGCTREKPFESRPTGPPSVEFSPGESPGKKVPGKLISKTDTYSSMEGSFIVSPDNTHTGYIAKDKNGEYAVIDGKKQGYYYEILGKHIWFSPDGKHTAYVARKGNNKVVVVDGKEGKEYVDIGRNLVIFSPDSKRIAYSAKTEGGFWTLVVDGKEEGKYPVLIGRYFFSPDSKRVVYFAMKSQCSIPVIDGKKGNKYVNINIWAVFSPDSKKVAFVGLNLDSLGRYTSVFVDEKPVKKHHKPYHFDEKSILQWKPFLKRMKEHKTPPVKRIWKFLDPKSKKIINAWKPGQSLDEKSKSRIINGMNNIVNSKDFYVQQVFANVKLPKHVKMMSIWMSWKFPSQSKFGKIKKGMFQRRLINAIFSKELVDAPFFINENSLVFDSDNQKVYYVVKDGSKYYVAVDDVPMKRYDKIAENLIFNPVSKGLAYVAGEGKKEFVVFDGKEGKKYDSVGTYPDFSLDGKRMAYAVQEGETQFVVIDGKEGKKYDRILKEISILGLDAKRLVYVGEDSGKMFSITAKIGQNTARFSKNAVVFSPDGKRTAYVAKKGDRQFAVIDGKEQKKYDNIITLPVFSSDGKHFAYVVRNVGKQFVVADGKEMNKYHGIITREGGKITFDSPNSFRYYVIENDLVYLVEEKL
ncbi:MAG: hypothetical protein K8T10_03400 [Candidatus Eremiobacteraeota bacterium]|nr:hypothetical protein [Candidatus Eremiobacteraeota bacterium]